MSRGLTCSNLGFQRIALVVGFNVDKSRSRETRQETLQQFSGVEGGVDQEDTNVDDENWADSGFIL